MKKQLIFMICPALSGALFGAVVLEVGTGILVETSGNVAVEVDSLVETGTGYLKGEVTSGAQAGMAEFAGMSLSAGLTGSITRHTGAAYSKGNGEGTNFLRYYEVNNTSGSDLTADMEITYVSAVNDERNSLNTPYFIYRYASTKWNGHGFGVSASPDTADGVTIPTGNSDWLLSSGSRLAVKVLLEGPYSTADDSMTTLLNDGAYIPTTSPHADDARPVSSVPAGVTDWVLLQVRSTATSDTVSSRSAFLDSHGNIVADDGATAYTNLSAFPGSYYIVVRQRNHLHVMSDETHALSFGSSTQYDFTTGSDKYYTPGDPPAKEIETGVWGMMCGDADQNGSVNATDYLIVKPNVGSTGYYVSDIDMNSSVNATDYLRIKPNVGRSSQVP